MLLFNPYCPLSSSGNTYFNTSNVTIQQGLPATAKVVYGNFNTSNVTIQRVCLLMSCRRLLNFNTSNVTIQRSRRNLIESLLTYFNTSNVTIQLTIMLFLIMPLIYFNTSNVTIQPLSQSIAPLLKSISIHLMLLFNTTMLTIFALAFLFQYI